jgi:hypothetical protein
VSLVDYLKRTYDPFEGTIPVAEANNQSVLFIGQASQTMMMNSVLAHYPQVERPRIIVRDSWEFVRQLRLAKTRSAHVSCWSHGEESEGMWRLYCLDAFKAEDPESKRGVGVAFQTTLEKLEASLDRHDLVVSPVIYRHYHEVDQRIFNDEMDQFMHKRMGFRHENELRLLGFNTDHYNAVRPDTLTGALPSNPPADLPDHDYLDWAPEDVIERITISPYADVDYENTVREAIASVDASLSEKVELSVLAVRRYPPIH